MPSDRTTVTELGTGLGMLGLADIDEAVRSRTPVMHSLSPEMWERLARLRAGGAYDAEFHAAWANGQAFLAAADGLRGRLPMVVEWKGTGRAPGDEVAPIDLRVDHVYLVSCKYLSKILFNVSPSHVFDDLLVGGPGRAGAGGARGAAERRGLVRRGGAGGAPGALRGRPHGGEPVRGRDAGAGGCRCAATAHRSAAAGPRPRSRCPGWARATCSPTPAPQPAERRRRGSARTGRRGARAVAPPAARRGPDLRAARRAGAVAPAGVAGRGQGRSTPRCRARWRGRRSGAGRRPWTPAAGTGEAMLWRLLRIGSAPYFVLGSSAARSLRLRIATSWDWRQQFQLISVSMEAQAGGQPRVGWEAVVRDRASNEVHEVAGHIEVRWSHGRFGGLPEAKGYLDTPHHLVPGYFTLR